jgi:hypothetical protein
MKRFSPNVGRSMILVGVLGQGCVAQTAKPADPKIRILDATFGDQSSHKTCKPDLALCQGRSVCAFTVGEMCEVRATVKNLEVVWDCGEGAAKKARAAAMGTKISLSCEKQ